MSLFDAIRRMIREELTQVRTAELAVVQEQHPHTSESDTDNYACTVRLRESGLVLRKVPIATQRIGAVSVPAVGDLVLVHFLSGDVNAPVLIGRLYNDEDRPPVNQDNQAILHLPLAAGDDDAVHMELHSGDKREFTLKLGKGLDLTLRDDDPVVELSVAGGKATLKLERDGAVTLESQGTLKLKGSDVALEGTSVAVEASGELKLKGATVNIN